MSGDVQFDIAGVPLKTALEVAVIGIVGVHKVAAWSVDKDGRRLILHWMPSATSNPLPAPMFGQAIEVFVESWLADVDYGPEPDTDGSTGKSVRVYTERWNRIGGDFTAFAAIEPYWMIYGK